MTLSDYFKVIESTTFQLQFSVLSGLSVVEFALSRDKTVSSLLALLRQEKHLAEDIFRRIGFLLPQVGQETKLTYDESIVAYLYILNKIDLLLAYRASRLIWDTDGLLWSRWMAFNIIQLVHEIERSLDVSSVDSVGSARSIAEDNKHVDTRRPAAASAVSSSAKADILGSYAFEVSTAA